MKVRRLPLIVLIALFSVLLAPASLASYDDAYAEFKATSADALHLLGLFNGVGINRDGTPDYALDRVPTRSEAIVILVRLLGKENEAKSGLWDMPFTDVAPWARPYVGYAYANGLAMGTGRSTFGGDDPVSASQFLTFVLRALGYKSGTDFRWDRAWGLSDRIGLTFGQYHEDSGEFLRGDAAAVSLSALFVEVQGSGGHLADVLIRTGTFTLDDFLVCYDMVADFIAPAKTGQTPEAPKPAPAPAPEQQKDGEEYRLETVHYEWDWLAWKWSYDLTIPVDAVEYYRKLERDPYSILTGYSSYVSDPIDDEYLHSLAQVFINSTDRDGLSKDDAVRLAISFVQSLDYIPDNDSLGYDYPKYPLETLYDKGGDCEDTSILLVSLIREMGYGCCLIEFDDHMGVGILGSDNVNGRYYERNGNKYFFVETTDTGWEIGEMPNDYVLRKAHIWPF